MSDGDTLSELERGFIEVLRVVGPEVAKALFAMAKSALDGEPEASLRLQAEHATTLLLFKAAYHREPIT